MRVHSVCGYPGKSEAWNSDWDDVHYRARNLVKGAKREPFGGYSEWHESKTNARSRQYGDEAGHNLALKVASSKLANLFDKAGIVSAAVIPVPSSQTVQPGGNFTGARLAAAVEKHQPGLKASPVLHFDVVQPKAHEGGERRWHMILPHLRGNPQSLQRPIVLLDDVMTGGGHLRACRRYLSALGISVADAFVIGRTVWERPANMFEMPIEHLTF